MKFLCLLLGLFCIISCSNSDVKTVATPPLEKEQKVTLSKQKSACDFTVAAFQCDSIPDRVIGDSCAQVWKNTWLEMLQLHLPKRKITVLGDAALLRSVSRVAIDQLGAQQPEWNGFRVYFAKQDTTDAALRHIPDLILVNANNCKDDTLSSDSVLLAMADNTHTFVGKQKASAFIQQWNTTANSAAFNPTAIKAYSFNRKDMESAAQMLGSAAAVTLQFYLVRIKSNPNSKKTSLI